MKRILLATAVIVFGGIGVSPGITRASPPLHHLLHHAHGHHSSIGGVGVGIYTPGLSLSYGSYGYAPPAYAPAYGYAQSYGNVPSYGYAPPYGPYIPPHHHHHHHW